MRKKKQHVCYALSDAGFFAAAGCAMFFRFVVVDAVRSAHTIRAVSLLEMDSGIFVVAGCATYNSLFFRF